MGARASRLVSDWILATFLSPDEEVRADLRTLRDRAREMVRNNAHAARFVQLLAENVVGPKGIRLQSRIERPDETPDTRAIRAIEEGWAEWGEPEMCTVNGRYSWVEVEDLVVRSLAMDGEALLQLYPGEDNGWGFAVQVLDPDQLDETYSEPPDAAGREVRMGVELDRRGRVLAYHLWDGHPRDRGRRDIQRRRVPANRVIHLPLSGRPGQTRAVTPFAPILADSKMLAGYYQAELVAARIAAAQMAFIRPGEDAVPPEPDSEAGERKELHIEVEPGSMPELPYGYEVTPWTPEHPTTAFPEFTKALLRSVASGLNVSYSSLTGDLRDVNYSSIRAGLLSERDVYRRFQRWLTTHLHRRVYREWLDWALTLDKLSPLTIWDRERARHVQWMPRGWNWIDPLKDTQAAVLAIRSGLSTLTRELANQGYDFEEILQERAKELALMEEYGITVSLALPAGGDEEERAQAPTLRIAKG